MKLPVWVKREFDTDVIHAAVVITPACRFSKLTWRNESWLTESYWEKLMRGIPRSSRILVRLKPVLEMLESCCNVTLENFISMVW